MEPSADARAPDRTRPPIGGGDFDFLAGDLALDFLNLRSPTPAAVLSWLVEARVLPEADAGRLGRDAPRARRLHHEAQVLHDAVAAAVEALVARRPVPGPVLDVLNRTLLAACECTQVAPGSERPTLVRRTVAEEPRGLLAGVASAAAELLARADPARLRRCEADDCRLWFVDTSRGGRRRWCSMATCGNRAKARRHQRRLARAAEQA